LRAAAASYQHRATLVPAIVVAAAGVGGAATMLLRIGFWWFNFTTDLAAMRYQNAEVCASQFADDVTNM